MNKNSETPENLICPEWCTRTHTPMEWEVGDVVHECNASLTSVGAIMIEQWHMSDGELTTAEDPAILLPYRDSAESFDSAAARAFGVALVGAADLLDSIKAAAA